MSYLGLVPSEHSSGAQRRQGAITKSGSRHGRRLLVEAAWHDRRPPRKGHALTRRQAGQPAPVLAISRQAQQRLHHSLQRLDAERGERRTIVATAAARELAGFCWAIATADEEPGRRTTSVEEAARPPAAHAREHPRKRYEQPLPGSRSTSRPELSRRNPVLRPPGSAHISLTARRALQAGPAAPSTDKESPAHAGLSVLPA
jgi:hypothetical protein